MRADRLLTMLLLLQNRGKLTAAQLAGELQVSPRTIYRDVDALSTAGIPIYAEAGPGGGFALLENYRTSLTGLNQGEVRALFMLALPETLAEFGLAPELRSAALKLSAALPPAWRQEDGRAQNRIYLDLRGAGQPAGEQTRLPEIYQAICQDRQLEIHYRLPFGAPVKIVHTVDPLGLVAHTGDWHLVYRRRQRIRARRVHTFDQLRLLPTCYERPFDFDLISWWHAWVLRGERHRTTCVVNVRVAPDLAPMLAGNLGPATLLDTEEPSLGEEAGDDGWLLVTLAYPDLPAARTHLLGLGRSVEVLTPPALRLSMQDYARQTVALYEGRERISRS